MSFSPRLLLLSSKSYLGMGGFACLVDFQEGLESFRAQYRILPGVVIRYCKEGQWREERKEGEIVIPMIAFIEEGMRIPPWVQLLGTTLGPIG